MERPPVGKIESAVSSVDANLSKNTWEAKVAPIFPRDFFQLQLEFAKILAVKWGKPLGDIIDAVSPVLKDVAKYSRRNDSSFSLGVDTEDFLEFSYSQYKQDIFLNAEDPVAYHEDGGRRFGCFSYDIWPDKDYKSVARIHFVNAEFDSVGPLDKSKIEKRRSELKNMLQQIKSDFPNIGLMTGESWLYNLPAYKRLFPDSYVKGLVPSIHKIEWARGTTIWGQFLDSEFKLKKDLAEELLRRARELAPDSPLIDLFSESSILMPPLETSAPIEDFYKMYGIE